MKALCSGASLTFDLKPGADEQPGYAKKLSRFFVAVHQALSIDKCVLRRYFICLTNTGVGMKRFILVGIYSLLAFILTGCGSSFGIRKTGTEAWIEEHERTALSGNKASSALCSEES